MSLCSLIYNFTQGISSTSDELNKTVLNSIGN